MARSLTITADAARQIGPNTPLRLDVAAALAYPDGSMTAGGLRREAKRGRLVIERVAGKDFTTLRHIENMRQSCRVEVKGQGSGSGPGNGSRAGRSSGAPPGLSSTVAC